MADLPAGWGALEYAESRARSALETWDSVKPGGLYLHKGMALAETMRALLRELETERQLRAGSRA